MVPLICEVSSGARLLKPACESHRTPHGSFRVKMKCHQRINYCLKNGSELFVVSNSRADNSFSTEEKVKDKILKQVNLLKGHTETTKRNMERLNEAYDRCRKLCEEFSRTFYLGTLVMDPERQKATWALYAWGRRLDDLIDGRQNITDLTPEDLDQWEERLKNIFRGRPHDVFDSALSDAITKFPIGIQPFKDMIEGMKMDLTKFRYKNFDEMYLYCYHVGATMALMTLPVLGLAHESNPENAGIYAAKFGIAIQMVNILRDVGEDARRGMIYLPQDELAQAGLSDDDVLAGKVTSKWKEFMKKQIKRVHKLLDDTERGIAMLDSASRWPLWTTLLVNRQILEEIEANDYDNFTKFASVSKRKKLLIMPMAYARSLVPPSISDWKLMI